MKTCIRVLLLALLLSPSVVFSKPTPNPVHLRIFLKGHVEWNSWRALNPTVTPDLSGAVLTNRELENYDLRKTKLIRTDFSGCRMSYIRFDGADMRFARLNNITIRKLYMDGTDLRNASLNNINRRGRRARKTYARMRMARLGGASMRNCNIHEGKLQGADFSAADLSGTVISWTGCKGAIFKKADMTAMTLILVDMTGTDLSGAKIHRSTLKYVSFKNAKMVGTRFTCCTLGINLDSAVLKRTVFDSCWFYIVREGYSRMLGRFLVGWKSVDSVDISGVRLKRADLPDFLKSYPRLQRHRDFRSFSWHTKMDMDGFIRFRHSGCR